MKEELSVKILSCLAALLLASMTLSAQVGGSGTIQGTVQDPSGAALPGANVTATNLATAVTTARQTTAAGFYVLSPLQPGDYSVKVEASDSRRLPNRASR
jgi:hypothetical protein